MLNWGRARHSEAVARTTDQSDGEMRCISYNYWILSDAVKNNYEILSCNYEPFSHNHEIRIMSLCAS